MKKMLTLALLVAATMSATVSASAQGRRGEFKGRRCDFRKEIRFQQCHCPRCQELRRMEFMRMASFDPRVRDVRFDPRFARMEKCCFQKEMKGKAKFDKRRPRR